MMMRCVAMVLLLAFAACAPTPSTQAAVVADTPRQADASTTPPSAQPVIATSIGAPVVASSSPTPPGDATDPSAISRACKVDTDCAVKNVGSCCGAYPACVNKDAATDPAGVRARCGKDHRMGVCSIPAIAGCSCVSGQCRDINAADLRPAH